MAFASAHSSGEPLSEMNTTPLIDVLLVLLMVLILSIPMATHTLDIPLPGDDPRPVLPEPINLVRNKVVLTTPGEILWNGSEVSSRELFALLQQTARLPIEPELQFEPEADASYDLSARVLEIIKGSGVTKFGFVGSEKYRIFGTDGGAARNFSH